MAIILMLLVVFAAVMVSRPAVLATLRLLNTNNIADAGSRQLVNAAVGGFVRTAIFAIGFALVGMPYTLFSFLLVWAMLGFLEYLVPTR